MSRKIASLTLVNVDYEGASFQPLKQNGEIGHALYFQLLFLLGTLHPALWHLPSYFSNLVISAKRKFTDSDAILLLYIPAPAFNGLMEL